MTNAALNQDQAEGHSETSGDLMIIEKNSALEAYTKPNGLDPLIDKVEKEVSNVVGDISTETGRKQIASLARKVATSKVLIDKLGLGLSSEYRKRVDDINDERFRAVERLQKIQDNVRKPLTDWEEKDKTRIADHEARLVTLGEYAQNLDGLTAQQLTQRVIDVETAYKPVTENEWEEFTGRALTLREQVLNSLTVKHALVVKAEEDAAELARLKKAEDDRLQKEREEKIAADAAAAAKKEAEEKAAAAAEAEKKRVQKEADDLAAKVKAEADAAAAAIKKAEDEKAAADAKAKKSEEDRIASEQKAAQDKVAAEALAEKQKKEAEEKAAQAERDKAAAAKKADDDATAKRAADLEHRSKINNAALDVLTKWVKGLTPEQGKEVIALIATGRVPNFLIYY